MKKHILTLAVASALSVSVSANANTTITFDDLTSGYFVQINNGYSGFNWDNFYATSGSGNPSTGYYTGIVSSPNVAFNGFGNPSSFYSETAFNLISMEVTKAWYEGITHFDGYVGNTITYSMDVFSTTAGPKLATFNWNGLNKLTMSDGNGTNQTVIDNLTVAAVPEAETYSMMLLGLGMLGFMARRRKNEQA